MIESFVSFTARSPQLQWGGSLLYLGYMRPIETSSVTCREEGQGEGEGQRKREEDRDEGGGERVSHFEL